MKSFFRIMVPPGIFWGLLYGAEVNATQSSDTKALVDCLSRTIRKSAATLGNPDIREKNYAGLNPVQRAGFRKSVVDPVYRRYQKALREKGVAFREIVLEDGAKAFEISAEPNGSPPNRLIAAIKRRTPGVRFLVAPEYLEQRRFNGGYLASQNVIFLPYRIFHGGVATSTVRHEIRHAFFESMRRQGRDSIFHASIRSKGGGPSLSSYDRFMSFEEAYTTPMELPDSVLRPVDLEHHLNKMRTIIRRLEDSIPAFESAHPDQPLMLNQIRLPGMPVTNTIVLETAHDFLEIPWVTQRSNQYLVGAKIIEIPAPYVDESTGRGVGKWFSTTLSRESAVAFAEDMKLKGAQLRLLERDLKQVYATLPARLKQGFKPTAENFTKIREIFARIGIEQF